MIKNLKINLNPKDAGLYPADDLPAYIDDLKKKVKVIPRVQRTDLKKGQVVVVLEGKFSSHRVIFLKQLQNCKAVVIGHKNANIPMFIIDERFLLATSVNLKIKEEVKEEGLEESFMDDEEDKEFSVTENGKKIADAVENEVKNVKGMKRYLCTPFNVPEGKDFYAMNF
ncbi:60S ribosomal protein L6 [Gurleya vavrai]